MSASFQGNVEAVFRKVENPVLNLMEWKVFDKVYFQIDVGKFVIFGMWKLRDLDANLQTKVGESSDGSVTIVSNWTVKKD